MNIVGLDIAKRKAQVCVTKEDGTIIEERSVVQRPEELAAFFASEKLGRRFLEKLVRGMYRETGHGILPLDVSLRTIIVPRHGFEDALTKANTLPHSFAVPPGFCVRYGVASENSAVSIWYFLIWGQLLLHAATFPPELAPPIAPA